MKRPKIYLMTRTVWNSQEIMAEGYGRGIFPRMCLGVR